MKPLYCFYNFCTKAGFVWLLLHAPAIAVEPENGWWFSPEKELTGLQLELQDGLLLIGYYTEINGSRVAYNGGCEFDGANCSGALLEGIEPTGIPFSLSFPEDGVSGTALIDGEMLPIQRFEYAWQAPPVNLRGVWVMSIRAGTIYTGEGLVLSDIEDDGGETVLTGVRDGTERRAVALYNPDDDSYVIAVDDSPNSINLYTLEQRLGVNTLTGTIVITDKNGQPQTATFSAIATRLAQQVPGTERSAAGQKTVQDSVSRHLLGEHPPAGRLSTLAQDDDYWLQAAIRALVNRN